MLNYQRVFLLADGLGWSSNWANSQVCNRSHWHDNGSRYGAEAESMGVAGLGNGFDQESTNSWVRELECRQWILGSVDVFWLQWSIYIYIYLYDLCACMHDVAGQPSMTNRTNTFCQSDSPNHWTACRLIRLFVDWSLSAHCNTTNKKILKALNFPAWTTPEASKDHFAWTILREFVLFLSSPSVCRIGQRFLDTDLENNATASLVQANQLTLEKLPPLGWRLKQWRHIMNSWSQFDRSPQFF